MKADAILGIPLIGLIGTVTIVAVVLIPPSIIKITIDKETALTYEYEKAQHALLSLLSSNQNGKSSYEILSTYALLNTPSTVVMKTKMNNIIGENYCMTTDEIKSFPPTGQLGSKASGPQSNEILTENCPTNNIIFNTIIVMPYNKESLVKALRIGVR